MRFCECWRTWRNYGNLKFYLSFFFPLHLGTFFEHELATGDFASDPAMGCNGYSNFIFYFKSQCIIKVYKSWLCRLILYNRKLIWTFCSQLIPRLNSKIFKNIGLPTLFRTSGTSDSIDFTLLTFFYCNIWSWLWPNYPRQSLAQPQVELYTKLYYN